MNIERYPAKIELSLPVITSQTLTRTKLGFTLQITKTDNPTGREWSRDFVLSFRGRHLFYFNIYRD